MHLRKYVQRCFAFAPLCFFLAGAVVSVPWPCASRFHRVILSDTSSFSRRLSFNPRPRFGLRPWCCIKHRRGAIVLPTPPVGNG